MSNDLVVVIGAMLSFDDKRLLEKIKESKVVLICAMEDASFMDSVELFYQYEAGSEEGVMAILTKEFLSEADLPKKTKEYFNDLDEGYISAETNIAEEEVKELHGMLQEASSPLIVFGKDMFLNPRVKNISRFINLIKEHSDIEIECLGELKKDTLHVEDIEELKSFDGTVVFEYNSARNRDLLVGSAQFAVAAKIKDGQKIVVENQNREFRLDRKLKGTIALMASQTKEDSYRFKVAKITKREL